jgi:hypothetical protein
MTATKNLYLGNAHLARAAITRYDGTTDAYVPLTSGTVTVRFTSDALGETTISGLGPFTMAHAGAGTWYYAVAQALIDAALDNETYSGGVVYEVVEGGADSALKVIQPFRVVAARPPL